MSYHERTPNLPHPTPTKIENPGPVLSDSLAAESAHNNGAFASNTNPSILSQSSHSTNTNTTDTSSATTLPPARDADARLASEESSGPKTGFGSGVSDTGKSYNTATSTSNSAPAPTYTSTHTHTTTATDKPKGKNLTEGGFSTDTPNASFGTKIGGGGDPGRVALGEFERRNAEPGDNIGREGQEGQSSSNGFEELSRDEEV